VYRAKDARLNRTVAVKILPRELSSKPGLRERFEREARAIASLIATILASEPKPMRTLQPLAPPTLERVVQTCLAKDLEDRWQNAHDMMRELEWVYSHRSLHGQRRWAAFFAQYDCRRVWWRAAHGGGELGSGLEEELSH
jgi:hypothetical protein